MRLDFLKYVTIIHPIDRIEEYRWLSAFFRLIGILVCERIPECSSEIVFDEKTDLTIIIDRSNEYGWNSMNILLKGEKKIQSIYSPEAKPYNEGTWIPVLLDNIGRMFSHEVLSELHIIAICFAQKDLMRRIYSIEYFGDTECPEIFTYIEKSRENFYYVYNFLLQYESTASKYMLAAICNCQRRLNELHLDLWNALYKPNLVQHHKEYEKNLTRYPYQNFEEINKRIEKILDLDETFYMAYAIRGFVKLVDGRHMLEAVYDFGRAIAGIGENPYSSCLKYRIGKYFEEIRENEDRAFEYFIQSFTVDKDNYRAAYKIAMKYKADGNYRKALKKFQEILRILNAKKFLPVLQPLECAYLYKANMRMGEIYMDIKQYDKAIEKFETAYLFGKLNYNIQFYNWMYAERGKIFKEEAVKKLCLQECQEALADAYAMNNNFDKLMGAKNVIK